MSGQADKTTLLRRLTTKSGSLRRKGSRATTNKSPSSTPNGSQILSNLSPDDAPIVTEAGGDAGGKPTMIDIGGQMVPLSTISIGLAILIVFTVIWRAVMTFSASLIRLVISIVVLGGFVMLSSASDKQASPGSNISSAPIATSSPSASDQSALELLEQYRRQHYQQASLSR